MWRKRVLIGVILTVAGSLTSFTNILFLSIIGLASALAGLFLVLHGIYLKIISEIIKSRRRE